MRTWLVAGATLFSLTTLEDAKVQHIDSVVDCLRSTGENVVIATTSQKKTTRYKKTKRAASGTINVGLKNKPLSSLTDECLHSYFANLNGHKPGDLYQLVIGEVEKPLFKAVLSYTNGNQSEAAEILGINRGTLRKKLKVYKLQGR